MKKHLCLSLIVCAVLLTGCKAPLNKYEDVFGRYYSTTLKMSTSADVLGNIQGGNELVSQSESVVASWGKEGKKDRTHWFNMVAFDEEKMTAVRKYGFILEETTWGFNRPPLPALRYDTEMVMGTDVLDAAYASGNEKLIAVLKESRKMFNDDSAEVTFDSDVLRSSVMMVKQALNSVINKLDQSPAYAAKLSGLEGLDFDHSTLGESRIRMVLDGDIVKIKIKSGQPWFKDGFRQMPFEEHEDVLHM